MLLRGILLNTCYEVIGQNIDLLSRPPVIISFVFIVCYHFVAWKYFLGLFCFHGSNSSLGKVFLSTIHAFISSQTCLCTITYFLSSYGCQKNTSLKIAFPNVENTLKCDVCQF